MYDNSDNAQKTETRHGSSIMAGTLWRVSVEITDEDKIGIVEGRVSVTEIKPNFCK